MNDDGWSLGGAQAIALSLASIWIPDPHQDTAPPPAPPSPAVELEGNNCFELTASLDMSNVESYTYALAPEGNGGHFVVKMRGGRKELISAGTMTPQRWQTFLAGLKASGVFDVAHQPPDGCGSSASLDVRLDGRSHHATFMLPYVDATVRPSDGPDRRVIRYLESTELGHQRQALRAHWPKDRW